MSESIAEAPPQNDLDFLGACIQMARQLYGVHSEVPPFALVEAGAEVGTDKPLQINILMSDGLESAAEKRLYIATIQNASLTTDSPRSAIVFESWVVNPKTSESEALMDAIHARGGSLRDHPDCTDAVQIFMESDAGTTTQQLLIERPHPEITNLVPHREPYFNAADDKNKPRGLLCGFHIPTNIRNTPEIVRLRAAYESMFTLAVAELEPGSRTDIN